VREKDNLPSSYHSQPVMAAGHLRHAQALPQRQDTNDAQTRPRSNRGRPSRDTPLLTEDAQSRCSPRSTRAATPTGVSASPAGAPHARRAEGRFSRMSALISIGAGGVGDVVGQSRPVRQRPVVDHRCAPLSPSMGMPLLGRPIAERQASPVRRVRQVGAPPRTYALEMHPDADSASALLLPTGVRCSPFGEASCLEAQLGTSASSSSSVGAVAAQALIG
jgi:hypothetical protein